MTGEDKLEAVLSRLHKPRLSGGAYSARCPAHDDHKPSLRVSLGRFGEVLIHCGAGCTRDAVLAALSLTIEDTASGRQADREPQRRHEYHDADGKVVAVKVKWSGRGKRFAWERPDGRVGLDGLDPGLYRRPQVDAAVRAGEVVFITEGERDADTVTATGRTATTGPHGASTWRSEWNAPLTGAAVVVVADRDKCGAHHAMTVAAELAGAGCTVDALVPPAPFKDVTELVAAGGKVEDLEPLSADTDLGASKVRLTRDGRPLFAMIPAPWIDTLDPWCLRLIALLDFEQGNGKPMAGRNLVAKRLGWGNAQTSEHLDHLAAAGLIKVEQSGQRRASYRVLNPSRTLRARRSDGPPQDPSVDHPVVRPDATCGPPQDPQSRSSGLHKVFAGGEADAEALIHRKFSGATVVSERAAP